MSSVWGNNIKISLFGESHGKGIGIIIDGLPAGFRLNLEEIAFEMQRRSPGKNNTSTPRKEKDSFEIISGFFEGKTTGTPLCCMILNHDTKSNDYEKTRYYMRPGHADYTGYMKYKGCNDFRGGGHFSGRLTAPIVFAGAIAKQFLKEKEIYIGSHVLDIFGIKDKAFDETTLSPDMFNALAQKEYSVLDDISSEMMKNAILDAKKEADSVGGIIETAIINVPAGIGSPFFDSVESRLAGMMFSIPAVKGLEFGTGFDMAHMKGSEANDQFTISGGKVQTKTNHNGGIQGGITNGMPIIFKTAFKPTPSIGKKQHSFDIKDMKETELEIQGRHDPCIVFRAVPVTEAGAALVILDILLEKDGL